MFQKLTQTYLLACVTADLITSSTNNTLSNDVIMIIVNGPRYCYESLKKNIVNEASVLHTVVYQVYVWNFRVALETGNK